MTITTSSFFGQCLGLGFRVTYMEKVAAAPIVCSMIGLPLKNELIDFNNLKIVKNSGTY